MIMAIEINTEDIFSVSTSQVTAIKKIDPARKVDTLPERGNALPVKKAESEPEQEEIDTAVRDLNHHAQMLHRELHFSIDKDSGHTVIKVIDAKTDEVIRQIPGEEALKVAQRLSEGADLEIFNSYT